MIKTQNLLSSAIVCIALVCAIPAIANEKVESFVNSVIGSGDDVVSVAPAAVDGFYVATMQDLTILYVSEDLRWIFIGDLIEARNDGDQSLVRHTDRRRNAVRARQINAVDVSDAIAFAPPFEKPQAVVHVFTDITCGYCRKLHSELADYHAKGIEIRYLAYPRSGIGSEPFNDMVSAWCADDPHTAITQLKLDNPIEPKLCENPVETQYYLGQHLGLRGTPMLVLGNGKTVGGYVNADELAEILAEEGLL